MEVLVLSLALIFLLLIAIGFYRLNQKRKNDNYEMALKEEIVFVDYRYDFKNYSLPFQRWEVPVWEKMSPREKKEMFRSIKRKVEKGSAEFVIKGDKHFYQPL